jgi:hypothetical protein
MLQNDGYTRRSILCSSMVDNIASFVSCEIRQNNDLIRILYLFFIYYLFYNEKSKVVEGGNIKGLNILTGFTISHKLSWMNNLILALEISGSVFSQKFKATG